MSLSTQNSAPLPLPGGVIPALPTPLRRDGSVDEAALTALAERAVSAGVDGLLALGSSGEASALVAAARVRVTEVVIAAARGRVPVIVGAVGSDVPAVRDAIAAAADAGAAASLVAPPAYGPLSQEGVIDFYEALATDAIPLLGYHIPAFTGVRLEPGTVAALARTGVLSGVKDSARDLEYLQQAVAAGADTGRPWSVYVGTDSLLVPAMLLGAVGGITLAASVAPAWPVELVAHLRAGRLDDALGAQRRLTDLILALRKGAFPAGAKAALSLQGIADATVAVPRRGLAPDEIAALQSELRALGVPGIDSTQEGAA